MVVFSASGSSDRSMQSLLEVMTRVAPPDVRKISIPFVMPFSLVVTRWLRQNVGTLLAICGNHQRTHHCMASAQLAANKLSDMHATCFNRSSLEWSAAMHNAVKGCKMLGPAQV